MVLLGIVGFTTAACAGRKVFEMKQINMGAMSDGNNIEDWLSGSGNKRDLCDAKTFLPTKVYKVIGYLIIRDMAQSLQCILFVLLIIYLVFVFLISIMIGMILTQKPEEFGKCLMYGFFLEIVIEFVVLFCYTTYAMSKFLYDNYLQQSAIEEKFESMENNYNTRKKKKKRNRGRKNRDRTQEELLVKPPEDPDKFLNKVIDAQMTGTGDITSIITGE